MIIIFFIGYLLITALLSFIIKIPKSLYYFNCLLIILLICLRGYDNGSVDTINYVNWVVGKGYSFYQETEDSLEPFYVKYVYFLQAFVKEGTVFLVINGALSLIPLFFLVKKYSTNPSISLFLFFLPLSNIHRMYFVCQRQILAMSVILIGFICVEYLQKKYFKLFVLIATGLIAYNLHHMSVLISVAYILLQFVHFKKIPCVILIVLTFLLGLFYGGITDFGYLITLYYSSGAEIIQLIRYSDASLRDSMQLAFIALSSSLLGISLLLYTSESYFNKIYSKLFFVSVLLFNLFMSLVEVYRLAGLFTIFGLMVLPTMLENVHRRRKLTPIICLLVLSAAYCTYSYLMTLYAIDDGSLQQDTSTLVPYKFFWEDKYNY